MTAELQFLRELGFAENFEERFWKKVFMMTDGGGCWLWVGARSGNGYGNFWRGINQNHNIPAHVLSWMIHHKQPVPDGMWVLHDCPGGDNRACVRPEHLWIGDQSDNMQDLKSKTGFPLAEKHPMRRLNWNQVTEIRQRYAVGDISQRELQEIYGIAQGQISAITRGVAWKTENTGGVSA